MYARQFLPHTLCVAVPAWVSHKPYLVKHPKGPKRRRVPGEAPVVVDATRFAFDTDPAGEGVTLLCSLLPLAPPLPLRAPT